MSIKPPVVERAIACRYSRVEPEAFLVALKSWKSIMAEHAFTETVVKHWDIKIPADNMGSPDLANSTMALREDSQYKKDGNTILRPCLDMFSVNLLGADNTSFDKVAQLAEQFIPRWLELIPTQQPQTVELIYVDEFDETHLKPFVSGNGDLDLAGVFKLPIFYPFSGGVFVDSLSQNYTWQRRETPDLSFSVTLSCPPIQIPNTHLAKFVQVATQTLDHKNQNLEHSLHPILRELHTMHSDFFQRMLTPAMLNHCGIEQNLSTEVQ